MAKRHSPASVISMQDMEHELKEPFLQTSKGGYSGMDVSEADPLINQLPEDLKKFLKYPSFAYSLSIKI